MKQEQEFRRGASHGAEFIRWQAKAAAKRGLSADELSNLIGDLVQVILDWRNDPSSTRMPPGNPWDWPAKALTAYIEQRKRLW